MCGIVGMVGVSAVNQRIYDALTVLQHRGQDAAGIMTAEAGELFMRKDSGLVRDVFQQKLMLKLKGNVGIGHVRYPTAGADSANDAQPFYVNSPYGICLGHNGNLTNARELTEVLVREDRRHLNTGSDSEVLLNVLASELQRVGTPRVTLSQPPTPSIGAAVEGTRSSPWSSATAFWASGIPTAYGLW
jgi:amidophosphoribosyltransferase